MLLKYIYIPLLLTLASCQKQEANLKADWVITGAQVQTMDADQPFARAIAIKDNLIVYVGNDAQAKEWIGENTQLVELNGNTLLPGFIDTHIHVIEGGLAEQTCRMGDEQLTILQIKEKIKNCKPFIASEGWILINEVNGAGFKATAKDLDQISTTQPLILAGSDGHTAWLNTLGLQQSNITDKTPNPASGRIERDMQGHATGFLIDEAVNLAYAVIPTATKRQKISAITETLPRLHASGITSFLEANVSDENFDAFYTLAKNNELNARVNLARSSNSVISDTQFQHLEQQKKLAEQTKYLRANFIKLFADGVLEYPTQSAALLSPYTDVNGKPSNNVGKLYISQQEMNLIVNEADKRGFGVHVHAIGDAATQTALNAFEAARKNGSTNNYSISHLQLIAESDYPRFAANKVLASFQLFWAQPENYSIEAVLPYIGKQRHSRMYPAASLLKSGATIAGGSDWNVSTFNPMQAIAIGVSRLNLDEPDRGTLNSDEKLALATMLQAYTINAAKLLGRDQEVGSLIVGKKADIVILDKSINESMTAEQIAKIKPILTFFDGKLVYQTEKTR